MNTSNSSVWTTASTGQYWFSHQGANFYVKSEEVLQLRKEVELRALQNQTLKKEIKDLKDTIERLNKLYLELAEKIK